MQSERHAPKVQPGSAEAGWRGVAPQEDTEPTVKSYQTIVLAAALRGHPQRRRLAAIAGGRSLDSGAMSRC
jgi:hypothetical protein